MNVYICTVIKPIPIGKVSDEDEEEEDAPSRKRVKNLGTYIYI